MKGRNYLNLESQTNVLNQNSHEYNDVKKQAFTVLYIAIMVAISFSVLLYVSQTLTIHQQSSKLLALENKLEEIKSKNENLEIKLAGRTSLVEVEKIAKNELNMVEPAAKERLSYSNNLNSEQYVADIPQEKFFLVQIYDKIISEVTTVQAKSLE